MKRNRRSIAAMALGAGLFGGGATGLILGTPIFASAEESTTTQPAESTTTTVDQAPATETTTSTADPGETDSSESTTSTTVAAPDGAAPDSPVASEPPTETDPSASATPHGERSTDRGARRDAWVRARLADLVADGTITQAQADAIAQALSKQMPGGGFGHSGDFGHGGGDRTGHDRSGHDRTGLGGALGGSIWRTMRGWGEAGNLLGLTPVELGEQLMEGKTLAQIANEQGVDPQQVIDALVAPIRTHLDEAVNEGRTNREQADQRLVEATRAITDAVHNGSLPFSHLGGHRRNGGSNSGGN